MLDQILALASQFIVDIRFWAVMIIGTGVTYLYKIGMSAYTSERRRSVRKFNNRLVNLVSSFLIALVAYGDIVSTREYLLTALSIAFASLLFGHLFHELAKRNLSAMIVDKYLSPHRGNKNGMD